MENSIQLVQNPIIKHEIAKIGKSVTERIDALNLENQIATEDTIQSIKKLRAELSKEHAEYNSQYKIVEEAYMVPIKDVKTIFKTEISEKFTNADSILKDKIGIFENQVKAIKRVNVEVYFNELCLSEKIDFVKFDQVVPDVNLSTTEKKYKETCNEFIMKVVDDLKLIKSTDYVAEILVEYKSTLNASKAITDVKTRKENEEKEKIRLEQIEKARRQNLCKGLGMVWVDMTNAYEYNADIYITRKQIEELSVLEFEAKIVERGLQIKELLASQVVEKAPEPIKNPNIQQPIVDNTTTPPTTPPVTIIEAPVVVEEVCEASFTVYGTMPQLRSLGQYMKSNNINYKNI